MKKTNIQRAVAITGALALGSLGAQAQSDSALLDALVQKGVLSGKEAEQIRSTEEKNSAETPASKITLSNSVTKLTIYGDARLRFEYSDEKGQTNLPTPVGPGVGAGDNIVERNRIRLRIGADYALTDHFKAGVELESNLANDSANQTLGNAYGKSPIDIGLAYLQWQPTDWLTLTGGKQRNPIYTTDLLWDPDINPEGASEVLTYSFPLGGGSAPMRDSKDMKDMKTMTPGDPGMSLSIGFTAFQGIYADNSEFNGKPLDNTDVWQFVEQVPVKFTLNKSTYFQIAPGFDTYMGGGNVGPGNTPANGAAESGSGTQAFTAINAADDLALVTVPGEFDFQFAKLPVKFYWDFVDNLDGHSRVQDVYLRNGLPGALTAGQKATRAQNGALGDDTAWLAGVQVGQNKKKGDWSIRADYRQVGLGSVDPNLNDSDWGDSFLNQQGVKVQSFYNFTDFLTGGITVYDTWSYKNSLLNGSLGNNPTGFQVATGAGGTTASGIANLAGVSQTQRVDVDLQWKF